jgi:colanic acid biosynthesis protein WcaH
LILSKEVFKIVIDSTPLVSVDILVEYNNRILLGRRINKPAQGYFFSTGGRVKKNENINKAIARIAKSELNIDLKPNLKFIGVFEHFYDDSIFECISTHYVNLAYKVELNMINNLPTQQHNEYRWFTVDELLASKQVHDYVKDYFKDYNAPTN